MGANDLVPARCVYSLYRVCTRGDASGQLVSSEPWRACGVCAGGMAVRVLCTAALLRGVLGYYDCAE